MYTLMCELQHFGVDWNTSINKWVVQLVINDEVFTECFEEEVTAGKKYDALVNII